MATCGHASVVVKATTVAVFFVCTLSVCGTMHLGLCAVTAVGDGMYWQSCTLVFMTDC